MKILVAIAHHGNKNREHLERVLDEYEAMPHDVDVVLLTELPKSIRPGVEEIVGLPAESPWSLPFGHRQLFADRRRDYDLFVYSEDDTLVTAANIAAFCEASKIVPDDVLPGFLRYELHPDGSPSYCSIHTHYHWVPCSVQVHGGRVFAEFTNLHAAAYVLSRAHLDRAIASEGFVVPAHDGRFDMLVTAATDVYTQCGFRRLVPVSDLDDFMLRHLPNVYLGRYGISRAELEAQREALVGIAEGRVTAQSLFEPETKLTHPRWDKRYHEGADVAVLSAAGDGPGRLLSIGVTAGALETALAERRWDVVAVPVDAIIGAVAALRGLRVLAPSLEDAEATLADDPPDRIIAVDVVAHVADPVALLRALRRIVAPSGRLVLTAPNLQQFGERGWIRRHAPAESRALDFATLHLHLTTLATMRSWARESGWRVEAVRYRYRPTSRANRFARLVPHAAERLVGEHLVLTLQPR